jgi:K+-sensing histidine kinase KdpD
MSSETRHRLLEPFHTTKETTGSGLGLWVCADIVTKYEGRISMRTCSAPGRSGSIFVLFYHASKADPSEYTTKMSALHESNPHIGIM